MICNVGEGARAHRGMGRRKSRFEEELQNFEFQEGERTSGQGDNADEHTSDTSTDTLEEELNLEEFEGILKEL